MDQRYFYSRCSEHSSSSWYDQLTGELEIVALRASIRPLLRRLLLRDRGEEWIAGAVFGGGTRGWRLKIGRALASAVCEEKRSYQGSEMTKNRRKDEITYHRDDCPTFSNSIPFLGWETKCGGRGREGSSPPSRPLYRCRLALFVWRN